jgi:hypothetical protein
VLLILGVLAVLCICVVGAVLLLPGGGIGDLAYAPSDEEAVVIPTAVRNTPAPTAKPFVAPLGPPRG